MYFGYLLSIFLYTLAVNNRAVARRVKIHRLSSGIDEFEVQDDSRDSICTKPEKATEFCAKHGAISVHNTRSCSNHEETLHCRCNSTKSTFLLHEGKCVNNENVTARFLHGGIPVCKFHVAVQNGRNHPRCERSPVSTLSTNVTIPRHYSLCTAKDSEEVFNCKIDLKNLLFNKAGRWRQLWRLDPRAQQETTIKGLLHKLISNASRYSGLILSLQATCLVKSQLSVRLRGQPPYDKLQSCLLLKVSGSRSWPLKPHQMSFTQSNQMNSELSVNQSRHQNKTDLELERNITIVSQATTQPSPTTSPVVEIATDKVEIRRTDNASLYKKLIYFMIGAFLGILWTPISIYFVFECASQRLKIRRRKRRRRSTGNPTYERGPDTSLVLMPMTAVNLSGSPVSSVSPYAHVYQPLVENTRPHSVNGYNNVYESLRSVRNNPELRRLSYSMYQDLMRANRVTSSGSNSSYQTMFTPAETTARDSLNSCSTPNYVNVPPAVLDVQCDLKTARDTLKQRSVSEILDEEECPLDETSASNLTVTCQSSSSSTLQDEDRSDRADGFELVAHSSSSLSLTSLTFYEEDDDISVESDQKGLESDSVVNFDSNEGDCRQHKIVENCDNTSSELDTVCDDLHDSTSDCRLSGLEIIIDSDCSECDSALEDVIDETETQSPSQPFYYVLEGPNPSEM
ncbi:hypothetical protein ACROYT_G032651 [Oculina patagonica]